MNQYTETSSPYYEKSNYLSAKELLRKVSKGEFITTEEKERVKKINTRKSKK
jgi:hypothetical protein